MRTTSRRRALFALPLVAGLAAAGCTSSGSPDASTTTVTSTTARSAPATTARPTTGTSGTTPGTTPGRTGGTTVGTSAPAGSTAALCGLLTDADFRELGVTINGTLASSSDEPGSAYCSYDGRSAAQGGVEADFFANPTDDDAQGTYATAKGEYPGGTSRSVRIPGADVAELNLGGGDRGASIIVRDGRFVYVIGLPSGDRAEQQLTELASRVVTRAGTYR